MTFQEIYEAIQRATGKNTTAEVELCKQMANMVYLDEIMTADELYPLFWMMSLNDSRRTVASANVTAVTKANPGVMSTANSFTSGDIATIYNISGMTELNARTIKVGAGSSSSEIVLTDPETGENIDTSSFTTYTSGGKIVHRGITLPSVESFLDMSFDDENNEEIVDITMDELKSNPIWWSDQTSRPKRWTHRKVFTASGTEQDQLWWFAGSDAAYYLRLWFQKRATRLSDTTDVPLLPGRFHDAIVAGAITRLSESNVQVENAVVWPAIYAAHLEAIVSYNRRYWKRLEQKRQAKADFF